MRYFFVIAAILFVGLSSCIDKQGKTTLKLTPIPECDSLLCDVYCNDEQLDVIKPIQSLLNRGDEKIQHLFSQLNIVCFPSAVYRPSLIEIEQQGNNELSTADSIIQLSKRAYQLSNTLSETMPKRVDSCCKMFEGYHFFLDEPNDSYLEFYLQFPVSDVSQTVPKNIKDNSPYLSELMSAGGFAEELGIYIVLREHLAYHHQLHCLTVWYNTFKESNPSQQQWDTYTELIENTMLRNYELNYLITAYLWMARNEVDLIYEGLIINRAFSNTRRIIEDELFQNTALYESYLNENKSLQENSNWNDYQAQILQMNIEHYRLQKLME